MKNIIRFARHDNNKLYESKDLKIRGWTIGESPNVFNIYKLLLLCSDRPLFIYQNVKIMHNNHDGDFQITKAEKDYWRRIDAMNHKFAPKPKVEAAKQYAILEFMDIKITTKWR